MHRLSSIVCFCLFALCPSLFAQTTGQWELRKRTTTGMQSYGLTAIDGQAIGFTAGVPAMLPITASSAWAAITGKPTTFPPSTHNQTWSTITSTPTTLAGYGITDALTAIANAPGLLHNDGSGNLSYLETTDAAAPASAGKVLLVNTSGELSSLVFSCPDNGSGRVGVLSSYGANAGFANGSQSLNLRAEELLHYRAADPSGALGSLKFASRTAAREWTLPDASGTVAITSAADGSISASALTSGTLPIARIADAAVTNAKLAGSIALSKLATTGTASASTYLRGDGAWTALDLSPYLTTSTAASTYAALSHNQAISTITGLQTALDAKAPLDSPTFTGPISGNGSGLTSLNASNISSGSLNISRITDGSITLAKLSALPMQAETLTYYNAVLAAGGTISLEVLARLDDLICDAKTNSYWADIIEAYPFATDAFTGVFVKLKAASGAPSTLTNNGFTSANYTRSAGFGINSGNTANWLQTGFTPSAIGVDRTNIGIIASITSDSVTAGPSSGQVIGDMISGNASECGLFLEAYGTNNAIGVGGVLVYQSLNPSARVLSAHGNASLRHACMDGVQMISTTGTFSGTLTGEISMFRVTRFSAARFQNGRLGFVAITTYMTPAKAKAATAAISRFERAIRGIYAREDAGLIAWGDSITATQGGGYTSFTSGGFAPLVARRSGLRLVNLGNMGARIDVDANQIGAVNQRADVLAMPERTALFMYGSNDAQVSTSDTTYNTALTSITADARAANRRLVICTPCFSQNATHQATLRSYATRCATAALADGHLFADTNICIAELATPSAAMTDTVHPNPTGHALMAEVIQAAMRGIQLRRPVIDLSSLAAGASVSGTVTMLTIRPGQTVTVTPPSTFDAGMLITARVTANDTVTYTVTNTTSGALDEESGAYTFAVSTSY